MPATTGDQRGAAEAIPPSVLRFAADGPTIFRRDQASSYAWWGNLAVVLGREPPDASHVANYRACIVGLLDQHPLGIGLITVVNSASTPKPSGRDSMIQMFRELWPRLDAALFIPNASGFQAAVLRSVMGCLILATGQRDRVRVERSLSSGVPWLVTKLMGKERGQRHVANLEQGIQRFCDIESAWSGQVDPPPRSSR
jgi:hypothetical protein